MSVDETSLPAQRAVRSPDEDGVRGRVSTLAAVIFDFDGLILDTETPIFEAWKPAYREHGCELALEDWQHGLGTHAGFDPLAQLERQSGRSLEREALLERVRERNRRDCEAQRVLPGVAERLGEARALGLGAAVASSSSRAWVTGWLGRHGLGPLLDCVCARDDVARVKPAPDLFLLAAERLQVPAAACLVFEDSPNGIRAARAAGMRCVAVPNAVTRSLALPEADLVLESLAALRLGQILERLALA
jgi:HAD superfamily hydrolase (TIGR01509 family)